MEDLASKLARQEFALYACLAKATYYAYCTIDFSQFWSYNQQALSIYFQIQEVIFLLFRFLTHFQTKKKPEPIVFKGREVGSLIFLENALTLACAGRIDEAF